MACSDVYLDQLNPLDVTDAELHAWAGISLKTLKTTIIAAEKKIRPDSEGPLDSIVVDQFVRFVRQHAAALKRILHTRDFAEKQFIPRLMLLHMMMKDWTGFSMEKQLLHLEGLTNAFEAAESSGHLVTSTEPTSQEAETNPMDAAKGLEREKDYSSMLLKLALLSQFDAPAHTKGHISEIVESLFPSLPAKPLTEPRARQSVPAFTLSLADISSVGMHITATYCLDEHLQMFGNSVKIFHLTPAAIPALRGYSGNRLATALDIQDVGDEILASWKALLSGFTTVNQEFFMHNFHMDIDRVRQVSDMLRFSKATRPSRFAQREKAVLALIKSQMDWCNVVVNDLNTIRINHPQRFYAAFVGIVSLIFMFWQIFLLISQISNFMWRIITVLSE